MDERKRREPHVFISEADLVELFSALIEEVIKDKYGFKITVSTYANELLEMAKHHAFDLFVLYLNNIIFPTGKQPAEARIKKALRLIIHLKTKYKKPIIGLYGWPRDPSYGRQAKLAGADFVFQTPCSGEVLREAIKNCLDKSMMRHILVVDDEECLLYPIKEMLEKYCDTFSVLTAEDGVTATEKLKENEISLVVTNLRMPGLNGFELLDHIKAHYPHIPVIITTGYDGLENERLAQSKGAAAYIRKPFKIEELTGAISIFLK